MKMQHTSFWCALVLALGALRCAAEESPSEPSEPGIASGNEAPDGEAPDGEAPRQVVPSAGTPPRPTVNGGAEEGPMPSGGVSMPDPDSPAAASPGCSAATLTPGNHEATLEHDGQLRQYLVHVPSSYDGTTPLPLVLDLHGLTSSARAQAALSGWREKADEEGFIVVHPDGLNASWNGGDLCCGNSLAAEVDDEGFMRAIVERLEDEGCVDEKRVYATGLSNGGAMAHLLACRAADVFAATAPVSMGNGVRTCEPVRPISVVMTRGTRDPLVAYEGGLFPSAAEDFEAWSALNGCPGAAVLSDDVCETHSNCAGGVEVTLCTLDAGHVLYTNSDGFSVPDVVWKTFERQSLP